MQERSGSDPPFWSPFIVGSKEDLILQGGLKTKCKRKAGSDPAIWPTDFRSGGSNKLEKKKTRKLVNNQCWLCNESVPEHWFLHITQHFCAKKTITLNGTWYLRPCSACTERDEPHASTISTSMHQPLATRVPACVHNQWPCSVDLSHEQCGTSVDSSKGGSMRNQTQV